MDYRNFIHVFLPPIVSFTGNNFFTFHSYIKYEGVVDINIFAILRSTFKILILIKIKRHQWPFPNERMNANKILSQKTSGLCGVLAPVIGLTCIGMAVLISPWFSWTENYLSDLGGFPGDRPIWAAHGTASIIFNIGLIVAGVLGVLFVLGLRKNHLLDSPLGNIGIIFYFLDACALIGIGIFPETTGPPPHLLLNYILRIGGLSSCFHWNCPDEIV